jgi:hypothetical protein
MIIGDFTRDMQLLCAAHRVYIDGKVCVGNRLEFEFARDDYVPFSIEDRTPDSSRFITALTKLCLAYGYSIWPEEGEKFALLRRIGPLAPLTIEDCTGIGI